MLSLSKAVFTRPKVAFAINLVGRSTRRGLQTRFPHSDSPHIFQPVEVLSDNGNFLFELLCVMTPHVLLFTLLKLTNLFRLWNFDLTKRHRALLLYLPPGDFTKETDRHRFTRKTFLQSSAPPVGFQKFPFPIVSPEGTNSFIHICVCVLMFTFLVQIRINYRYHGKNNEDGGSAAQDIRNAYKIISEQFCDPNTKIALYGKYLGAAYALSLALNNQFSATKQISAVALAQGIYDWTKLAAATDYTNDARLFRAVDQNEQLLCIATFLRDTKLMRAHFAMPSECWDAFVSPVLYFRSAGVPVRTEYFHDHFGECDLQALQTAEYTPVATLPQEAKQFPPLNSGLEIPRIHFWWGFGVGVGNSMESSAEMAQLIQESMMLNSRSLDPWREAHQRIQLSKIEEVFDLGEVKRKRDGSKNCWSTRIAKWLQETMEQSLV